MNRLQYFTKYTLIKVYFMHILYTSTNFSYIFIKLTQNDNL